MSPQQHEDNHTLILIDATEQTGNEIFHFDLKYKFINKMRKCKIQHFSYKFDEFQEFSPFLTTSFEMCYSRNLIISRTILSTESFKFFDMQSKKLIQSIPLSKRNVRNYCLEERLDRHYGSTSCYLHVVFNDYSVACYDLDVIMKLNSLEQYKWKIEDSIGMDIDISNRNSILFVVNPFRQDITLLRSEDGSFISRHPCEWGMDDSKSFKFCDDKSTLFHTRKLDVLLEGLKFNANFSQIIEISQTKHNDYFPSSITFEEITGNMLVLGDLLTVFDSDLNIKSEFKQISGNCIRLDRKQGHLLTCGSPTLITVYK